ncbi:MAG: SDR family NAD(P)-dependent oxidoreductase [Steroidobacteraceae bacterium]
MDHTFKGRAAIVTGASSGIGRAIAQRLGEAGMEQWLVGRSMEGLEETAAAIKQAGGGPTHCETIDLQKRGPLGELVKRVGDAHPHLFAVINNAGLMHPEPIIGGRMDRWEAMFAVNTLAPLESCSAAVEVMRKHGKAGHLLNIGSLAGRLDVGRVYGASKSALDMISRSLRLELEGDDIRVTSIVPGVFQSQLMRHLEPSTLQSVAQNAQAKGTPLAGPGSERVMGSADDIARTVLFVLQQPINLNLQEVVIRPAATISW